MNEMPSKVGTGAVATPWSRLKRPARVTLLWQDTESMDSVLRHIANADPAHPEVDVHIPRMGLNLESIHCDPLTVTAFGIGESKPAKFGSWWVNANTDGMLLSRYVLLGRLY